jgi:autotransporter-associated beta strand protein
MRLASAGGPAILGNITFTQGGFTVTEAPNQFGPTTTLTFNSGGSHAEIALYGSNQTVAGITSANDLAVIQNSHGAIAAAPASSVLTVDQDFDSSYSGYIRDNTGNDSFKLGLTKDGTGALTLTGPYLSYTGVTTIIDGTLNLDGPIGGGANIVNASGGATNFHVSQTLAELSIANGAEVTLGAAAPAPFADGAAVPEPGTAGLLLLGALSLLSRRARK